MSFSGFAFTYLFKFSVVLYFFVKLLIHCSQFAEPGGLSIKSEVTA